MMIKIHPNGCPSGGTIVKTYNRRNYDELLKLLTEHYGFEINHIHANITEIVAEESPILRLIFDESKGGIIASFHIRASATQAIMIFDFIKEYYDLAALADVYYVNSAGTASLGESANIAYEQDIEHHYADPLGPNMIGSQDYIPDFPVTLVIRDAMYEAAHPTASIAMDEFKKRKSIF